MKIVVIAHNIRSIHNLGSILRTCDGFGVDKVFLSGYTPNFLTSLPHIKEKLTNQIHKTALGAEKTVKTEYFEDIFTVISKLKEENYTILGLEQDPNSIPLNSYKVEPFMDIALILGEEVRGITSEIREKCECLLEIPMKGQKESFNVSVATGIALHVLTS